MNSFGWIDDTHHEKKDTKLHRCLSTTSNIIWNVGTYQFGKEIKKLPFLQNHQFRDQVCFEAYIKDEKRNKNSKCQTDFFCVCVWVCHCHVESIQHKYFASHTSIHSDHSVQKRRIELTIIISKGPFIHNRPIFLHAHTSTCSNAAAPCL